MSKRARKRRDRKRNKANHGKRPNAYAKDAGQVITGPASFCLSAFVRHSR